MRRIQIKILGVAFEGADTELVFRAHRALVDEGRFLGGQAVLVGDASQIARRGSSSLLSKLFDGSNQRLFTLETAFGEMRKTSGRQQTRSELIRIMRSGRASVSTGTLSRTDHQISQYERWPTYRRLSSLDEELILAETFKAVEGVLDTFEPDLVWCIHRNYLVKNLTYTICRSRGIRFETFIPSRLGDIWLMDPEFGVGTSQRMMDYMAELSESELKTAQAWRQDMKSSLLRKAAGDDRISSLYENAFMDSAVLGLRARLFSRRSWIDLVVALKRSLAPATPYRWKLPRYWGHKYAGSTWGRKSLYHLAGAVRVFAFRVWGRSRFEPELPKSPYFFLPLHWRPEDSTLTLGMGTDDEEVIDFVMRRLPLGYSLVIKENAQMVQDRRGVFYRRLRKYQRVHLIDPRFSTPEVIAGATGVLGVSGTALLEAEILGKPAIALGQPEFSSALTASGFDALDSFFSKSTKDNDTASCNLLDSYLGAVKKHGFRLDQATGQGGMHSNSPSDCFARMISEAIL